MEEYNEDAYQDCKDKALDQCPNCGRKFLPDRLVVHLRSCKTPVEDKKDKPKNLMPSAKVKEPSENSPKREKKKPESIAALIRAAREGAKQDAAAKAGTVVPTSSKTTGLEPAQSDDRRQCSICNRKFAPDRFDVHYNICAKKSGKPMASAGPKAGFKASYD